MKKEDTKIKQLINSIPQKGIPLLVFFALILIFIFEFGHISKSEAQGDVIRLLNENISVAMNEFTGVVEDTQIMAETVAEAMRDEKKNDTMFLHYAEVLQSVQKYTNTVVIANNKGRAYTSEGETLNIKDSSYFSPDRGVKYAYVENEELTSQDAIVISVPYYNHVIHDGTIYMIIPMKKVKEIFSSVHVDGILTHVICDNSGHLLVSEGKPSVFTENSRFIENFEDAALKGSSVSRLPVQFASGQPFMYRAKKSGEICDFLTVPVGISDWMYTAIIDNNYTNTLMKNERRSSQGIVIGVLVVIIGFTIYIVAASIYQKIKTGEQNNNLSRLAETDLLTGLNNKIATQRKIQEYIEEHPDDQGVFFIFDIDNFKKINDTQGHAFGDEVLKTLGKQISNEFRISDIIGRTGGDEFIIFLKGIQTDELVEKEARRLLHFFRHFQVGEYVKYSATASIGATVYPKDASSYEELYKAADAALYEAKKRGKNRLVFYHKSLPEIEEGMKKDKTIDSDK